MEPAGKWAKLGDWAWFLVLATASSIWCVAAAWELGATFDEPVYVARGLEFWRSGSHAGLMRLGTMPLPVDLDTLPLYLWEKWHGSQLDPEQHLDQLLPWARAGTLVFWWLLLFYGRLAGRELAGPWGGRLAVALLACEPCLLAHASLATTDIAVTACLLALVYHFRAGRNAGWLRRVGLPAFWFAAAVLAKASGLVFGGLCLLVIELEQRFFAIRNNDGASRLFDWLRRPLAIWLARPFLRDVVQLTFLGMALVFVYCGCDWRTQPAFVEWAEKLPEGATRQAMTWMADHLRIFPNAAEGIVRQVKHNVRGHGTYLLGASADRSIWYYFPLALTIKLSLTVLLLPLLLALVRPRALASWASLAALVLLIFSLNCRVQIGIRLVLPLVVFAILGLAAGGVRACQSLSAGWQRRLLAGTLGAGAAWTAAAAVHVWPEGLCYVNELWGGTRNGYHLLSDSNYDWGQGLKELAAWQRRQRLPLLDVWYFGTDPTLCSLPLRNVPLHLPPLQNASDVLARVPGRYLAASTTMVYGNMTKSAEHRRAADFLRARRPIARTTTFLIYDLSQEPGRLETGFARRQRESIGPGPRQIPPGSYHFLELQNWIPGVGVELSGLLMKRNVEALTEGVFDLLILGGGITGAGVALDAAQRGFRVALIDKGDFASGTSSVSSKLVHGGLRYLEHGVFRLVHEALHERRLLLENAPHLVRPLRFIIPYYPGARVAPWQWRAGLTLYDLLAGASNIRRSKPLRTRRLRAEFPGLRAEGLSGGASYFDAQMDDARLCLEVMQTAAGLGAGVVNYVEASAFEFQGGRITGVRARDHVGGKELFIRARQVLNATGPWVDEICRLAGDDSGPRLQPTKGVHLLAPGRDLRAAFLLLHPADGRVFFVIPWMGKTLIGTTDTLAAEDPDHLAVTAEDVAYLLEAHNHYFAPPLDERDLLGHFAGLRPLLRAGHGEPSSLSREYRLFTSPSGLLSVAGGKYTTYRHMAEVITDTVAQRLGVRRPCRTRTFRLHGAPPFPWDQFAPAAIAGLVREKGLQETTARHLVRRYGKRAGEVADCCRRQPELLVPVIPGEPDLAGELVYQREHEMVMYPADHLLRRTRLGLFHPQLLDLFSRGS